MLVKNQIVELTIDSLSNDGSGVGRVDGMAVFVPDTAVGDRIAAKIVRPKPSYAFGIVQQLLTPSPDRIEPDCAVHRRCGGCSFRHISYAAELRAKREMVRAAIERIGGLHLDIADTVPSPSECHYRNKVQFPVCERDGRLAVGMFARRTHEVVSAGQCLLQPAILNEIAAYACAILDAQGVHAYDEMRHKGLLQHLFLRRSGSTGEVMLCPVLNGDHLPDEATFVQAMTARFPVLSTILLNINRAKGNVILGERCRTLYGDGLLRDEMAGVPVRLSPLSFFQVNTPSAENLYAIAARLAAPAQGDTLLDLYCGTGTIGLSILRQHPHATLIGVEVVPSAVKDAEANAQAMPLENCTFICADAGQAATQFAAEQRRIDVAIVDPPRKGCDSATIDALLRIAPARIVMISCNPATLARDLKALCASGYTAGTVTPVDLFPRTAHVEAVVLLTRIKQ